MIALQESIGPGAGALKRTVFENHGLVNHLLLFAVGFEPIIRQRPDALFIADFALAVACAAARAVALVFGALRFGAQVRDLRQGTVAAVLAVEAEHLQRKLDAMGRRAAHFFALWIMERVGGGDTELFDEESELKATRFAEAWLNGWRPSFPA